MEVQISWLGRIVHEVNQVEQVGPTISMIVNVSQSGSRWKWNEIRKLQLLAVPWKMGSE